MMPETEGQSGREVRQSQGLILFLVVSGVAASVTGLVVSQGVVARVAFGVTLGLSLVYLGVVRRLCQIILPVLAEYRANDQKVQSLRTQIATLDSQLAGARVELEQARLLGELVRQISEANDLERVLAVVLRRSMEVFSVQHGFIMLNDKESPGYLKVVAAASNDPQPSLPSGRVRIGEGIAGWVAQTGQPYLHNPGEEAWKGEEGGAIRRRLWQAAETSVGRAFPETARREPPPSNLLCVPILHGPRPIGVITLEERRTGPFVPREAEFLSLIGRELSGAIDKARLQDEIQELSITDELTGLPNRRYFNRRFHEELARARRSQFPVTVTMLDIDHFKQVNDTYGHPFGDEVLQALARALQSVVREADILARYGGEEFVIVSPECTTHLARRLVQRIQNAVANVVVVFAETQEVIGITVSLGLASFPDDAEEGVAVIECADLALYHAKRSGRDRACVYDEIKDIQLPPEGPDH